MWSVSTELVSVFVLSHSELWDTKQMLSDASSHLWQRHVCVNNHQALSYDADTHCLQAYSTTAATFSLSLSVSVPLSFSLSHFLSFLIIIVFSLSNVLRNSEKSFRWNIIEGLCSAHVFFFCESTPSEIKCLCFVDGLFRFLSSNSVTILLWSLLNIYWVNIINKKHKILVSNVRFLKAQHFLRCFNWMYDATTVNDHSDVTEVSWLLTCAVCWLQMEGDLFGNVTLNAGGPSPVMNRDVFELHEERVCLHNVLYNSMRGHTRTFVLWKETGLLGVVYRVTMRRCVFAPRKPLVPTLHK